MFRESTPPMDTVSYSLKLFSSNAFEEEVESSIKFQIRDVTQGSHEKHIMLNVIANMQA